ncbi:MAG: hypothetical protein M5T61_19255 [Acidimicrobiia bacterium]|nr:hypothetical protein [Acidimicrobiia bacterium]
MTAQAITTIEDEVRVAISDAHIEVTFLAYDLCRSDPANLVTRLERHLHRLPDTVAELHQEAAAARAEAERATARIGVPWDRGEELAGLHRRQKDIDEALAASTEPAQEQQPVPSSAVPHARSSSAFPDRSPADVAGAARMAARLDALQRRSRSEQQGVGL